MENNFGLTIMDGVTFIVYMAIYKFVLTFALEVISQVQFGQDEAHTLYHLHVRGSLFHITSSYISIELGSCNLYIVLSTDLDFNRFNLYLLQMISKKNLERGPGGVK